jgi:hypothetical protein
MLQSFSNSSNGSSVFLLRTMKVIFSIDEHRKGWKKGRDSSLLALRDGLSRIL